MKTMKVDRVAAALLLPTFTDAQPEWLAAFTMPTRWCCAGPRTMTMARREELVEALPNATYVAVPGTHMSSVTKPEFGDALARFLAA